MCHAAACGWLAHARKPATANTVGVKLASNAMAAKLELPLNLPGKPLNAAAAYSAECCCWMPTTAARTIWQRAATSELTLRIPAGAAAPRSEALRCTPPWHRLAAACAAPALCVGQKGAYRSELYTVCASRQRHAQLLQRVTENRGSRSVFSIACNAWQLDA